MQRTVSFHKWVASISGVLVLALMLLIVFDSLGRFFFAKPLSGGVELSTIILGWVIFLSLGYGLVRGTHVRVSMLISRLRPYPRLIAEILTATLSLIFFGWVVYAGWEQFWDSYTMNELMAAPIAIPFWLAKLSLPIGSLIIVGQLIIILIGQVKGLIRKA